VPRIFRTRSLRFSPGSWRLNGAVQYSATPVTTIPRLHNFMDADLFLSLDSREDSDLNEGSRVSSLPLSMG